MERSVIQLTQHQRSASGRWSMQQEPSEPFKTRRGRFSKSQNENGSYLSSGGNGRHSFRWGFWKTFPDEAPIKRRPPCWASLLLMYIHTFLHFSGFLYKNKVILHSYHWLKLGYKVRWTAVIAQNWFPTSRFIRKKNEREKKTLYILLQRLIQTNKYASALVHVVSGSRWDGKVWNVWRRSGEKAPVAWWQLI